jgi:hypothetical protein
VAEMSNHETEKISVPSISETENTGDVNDESIANAMRFGRFIARFRGINAVTDLMRRAASQPQYKNEVIRNALFSGFSEGVAEYFVRDILAVTPESTDPRVVSMNRNIRIFLEDLYAFTLIYAQSSQQEEQDIFQFYSNNPEDSLSLGELQEKSEELARREDPESTKP